MDLSHLIQLALTVVGGTLGVWACTEIVKAIPAIPIFKGDTVKIRAFTGFLAALLAAFSAWQQGALTAPDLQNVILTLLTFAGAWAGSHGVHETLKPIDPEDQA